MSPAGASSCVPRRMVAPACRDRHRLRRTAVLGLVEAHLAQVVQQRGGLELRELVTREAERGAHGDREVGDALGVTVAHHAAELRRRAERADRLVVRAADDRRGARTSTRRRAAGW